MSARLIDRMDPEYHSSPFSNENAAERALAHMIELLRARGTSVKEIPPSNGDAYKSYEFYEGDARKIVTIESF